VLLGAKAYLFPSYSASPLDLITVNLATGVGNLIFDGVATLSDRFDLFDVQPGTAINYSFKNQVRPESSEDHFCNGAKNYGHEYPFEENLCSSTVSLLGVTQVDLKLFTINITSPITGFLRTEFDFGEVALLFKGARAVLNMAPNNIVATPKGSFATVSLVQISPFGNEEVFVTKRFNSTIIISPNGDVRLSNGEFLFNLNDFPCGSLASLSSEVADL